MKKFFLYLILLFSFMQSLISVPVDEIINNTKYYLHVIQHYVACPDDKMILDPNSKGVLFVELVTCTPKAFDIEVYNSDAERSRHVNQLAVLHNIKRSNSYELRRYKSGLLLKLLPRKPQVKAKGWLYKFRD